MSAGRPPHRARVILGATCFADAEASLQIAVVLAKQINGELYGVLVTDDAILASVSTPHARTVSYSGRSLPNVTEKSMHAAFSADARLFEKRLVGAAQSASLVSGFSEARGRLTGVLSEDAAAGDLVVFGFRRIVADGDRVVLVFGGTPPDPDLLNLGAHLSKTLRKPLTVFAAPEFETDITARLSELSVTTCDLQPFTGVGTLLIQLEMMTPAAVVVGFDISGFSSVMRLIDAARCPVVVPF